MSLFRSPMGMEEGPIEQASPIPPEIPMNEPETTELVA